MLVKPAAVEHLSLLKLHRLSVLLCLASFLLLSTACKGLLEPVPVVTSAEANVFISLQIKDGIPLMKVDYKNRSIVNPSTFPLSFSEKPTAYRFGEIIPSLFKGVKQIKLDSTFKVFNVYNDMSVELLSADSSDHHYQILFRVYEEGFGLKYKISQSLYQKYFQNTSIDSVLDHNAYELIQLVLDVDIEPLTLQENSASKPALEGVFQRKDDRVFVGIEPNNYGLFKAIPTTTLPYFKWEMTEEKAYESQWIIMAIDEQNLPRKRAILRAKLRQ